MKLNNSYRAGLFMVFFIILIPFLNYVHLLFSENNDSISVLGLTITHELDNNQFWAWSLINYFIQFIFLILLYFTTEYFFRFLLFPIISLSFLSLLSLLEFIPNLYEAPISNNILLIAIFSTLIIFSLDKRRTSKYQTVIVNKIVAESLFNWVNSSLQNGITRIMRLKEEQKYVPRHKFLRKAVYLKIALQEQHDFLLSRRTKEQVNSLILREWSIYLIILLIYFFWFLPYFVPEDLKTIDFLGFQISSFGFKDVSILSWFASRKLVIVLILSTWFVTSPHWWRYAIICPLIIYSYQFWEVFQDVRELDSAGNLRVLPLVILNVVLVIMVSRFVKHRSQFMAVYNEISMEVDEIIDELKSNYPRKVKSALEEIRKTKKGNEYQQKLRALEEEIASKLDLTKG